MFGADSSCPAATNSAAWNGAFHATVNSCEWAAGSSEGSLPQYNNFGIRKALFCYLRLLVGNYWYLTIRSHVSSCGLIWEGHKVGGNTPIGVYTKYSGYGGPGSLNVGACS